MKLVSIKDARLEDLPALPRAEFRLGAACVGCGNVADRYKCPNCGAPYCGPECFKREWKGHKRACRESQAQAFGEEWARTGSRGYDFGYAAGYGDIRKMRQLTHALSAAAAKTKFAKEADFAVRSFVDFIDPRDVATTAFAAAEGNRPEAVRLLLEGGASVGATTGGGASALYIACQEGQIECARLLVEAGAATDQADARGCTPLYVASQKGHGQCVRLLLEAGAARDQAKQDGVTPLFAACENGRVECARLLLESGAAKDQTQPQGITPLYAACWDGHLECVQLLLGASAAVNPAKAAGHTPQDTACQRSSP